MRGLLLILAMLASFFPTHAPKQALDRLDISRRDFIKGVIVGGAAVSSAGYLFRASTLLTGLGDG